MKAFIIGYFARLDFLYRGFNVRVHERGPSDVLGEIARHPGPRRSAAVNGRSRPGQGRKRASRVAIDSENGVGTLRRKQSRPLPSSVFAYIFTPVHSEDDNPFCGRGTPRCIDHSIGSPWTRFHTLQMRPPCLLIQLRAPTA